MKKIGVEAVFTPGTQRPEILESIRQCMGKVEEPDES
jgi:methylmalonyl-CoA mutase cobalamin-binding subunit